MSLRMRVHDREPIGAALRRFKKLLERSGFQKEMRKRRHYEKPSEVRRRDEMRKRRNMRNGNIALAASAFREVINRHDGQPFAHYFLAQAYQRLNEPPALIAQHARRFVRIIESDPEWKEHAERWNLDIDSMRAVLQFAEPVRQIA